MITRENIEAAFRSHPQLDRMWVAKIAGCSIINGQFVNGGDWTRYEIKDRDGNCHSYMTMKEVLSYLNGLPELGKFAK